MTKEKKELTEEQISSIKSVFSGGILGSDLFEEEKRKELKNQRIQSGTNGVMFGKLLLLSYDTFNDNMYKLSGSENEIDKTLKGYLDYYSEDIEELRKLIEDCGFDISTYYIGEKIKDIVNNKRGEKNEMINLFFRVFVED